MIDSLQTPLGVLVVLTAAVTLGYIAFGVKTFQQEEQVGVTALSLFSCLWGLNFLVSSVVVFVLFDAGISTGLELVDISFSRPVELFFIGSTAVRGVLTIGAIFAWFWFVYEYTTRPQRRDDFLIIGLGVGLAVIATLNGLVGALAAFGYISPPSGVKQALIAFASLPEILGTGIAIGVGTAQLFRTARTHPPFGKSVATALTLPIVLPYLLRYAYQFGLVPGFRTIQGLRLVALFIGLVGLGLATGRYRLFEQLPAAQVLGREQSFETTSTAVAVLDDNDVVADLNAAVRSLFGVTDAGAIGQDLDQILPATVSTADITADGTYTFEVPEGGTVLEANTTVTTDDRGRDFGSVIVFKDITAERRRQQRIQVLNRVLRHNLRNSLMVAHGHIDMLSEAHQPSGEHITKLERKLEDLVEMGSKAGQIENVLNADTEAESARPLADIVEMAIEEAADSCDVSHVAVRLEEGTDTTANPFVLQSILTELIINAVHHTADANITVSLTEDGTGVVVADMGSGIPDNEIAVFASGEETPLQHGNGLGLWLVKWGVGRLGASFDLDSDSSGTTATIRLPERLVATAAVETSLAASRT